MKKAASVIAALILLSSLTACGLRNDAPESIVDRLDGIVGQIGDSRITDDAALLGERNNSEDSYTGKYMSECGNQTGRDVVFGGGSVQERIVHIYGRIVQQSGSAKVRIRINAEAEDLEIDENGNFETTLRMTSGGNYIMLDYENFTGSVELISEYCRVREI